MRREHERRKALAEALRDVLDHQDNEGARGQTPQRPGKIGGRKLVISFLVVSWGFIAWVWLARPAFIFGTTQQVVTPEVRDASLRFALYLQRGRIERYAAKFGRLPASLDATGDPVEDGVTYVRDGDRYTLVGRDSTLELQLTNRMRADSFLGSSLDILRAARPSGPQ